VTLDRFVRIKHREEDEKVNRLVKILRELGLDCARTVEEKVDLQFDALKNLRENLNDELFIKLVIANSLVSYQLSGKGEEWWWEFSRYFSENPPEKIAEAYSEFLPNSRTNKRLVAGKLKRIERVEPFLNSLSMDELRDYYFNGMERLREDLARVMNAKRSAKTIVFAVKMFGYAGRIAFNAFVPYPMAIEIPEDVRIKAYTKRLTNEPPVSFWRKIAKKTGIPPLHIDSLLWPVLGGRGDVLKRAETHCPEVLELGRLL